jgi:hypothetical protein
MRSALMSLLFFVALWKLLGAFLLLSVTETRAKENPMQFITDYQVEANITADTTILAERMGKIAETGCEDLYGDGGYYSDEVVAQA